jgi:hypothetical protein
MLLKLDQARLIHVRSTHVDLFNSGRMRFLNHFPEKKHGPTQVMKSGIGACVLVNQSLSVCQGENSSHRPPILVRQPNIQPLTETVGEISKPRHGLRGNLMTPPRKYLHCIKGRNYSLRTARFPTQFLSFGAPYLSQHAARMKSCGNIFQLSPDIERVMVVPSCFSK